MKKILTIIFIFASLFASSQELMNKNFEGFRVKVSELVIDNDTLNMSGTGGIEANSIDVDTMKIDGVPLLLNAFKKDSLGGAGNIFYSTGASSQPASGSLNQVAGSGLLTDKCLTRWDGSKFVNSGVIENDGRIGIGINPFSGEKLQVYGNIRLVGDGYKLSWIGGASITSNDGNSNFQIYTGLNNFMVTSFSGTAITNWLFVNRTNGRVGISTTNPTEKLDVNGNIIADTIKARADIIVTGEIYDEINHLYGMFYDSTITLSLTQNVWQQVTNPTKTLYSTAEQDGVTISGDTIVFSKAGGYDVYFEINGTGIDSKDYHYRILQKNGTTTVRSYNKYASTGTQVLRIEKAYVHVAAGSKVWCEIMSPSSAPGSITIQGAKIYAMQRYLEK